MKKTLLIAAFAITGIGTTQAQVLMTENFNTLVVGNLGTDLTGVTPGQGGWLTFNATGGTNSANSNYQIISDSPNQMNVLQITGSDAATGTRYAWKGGLDASWATRTVGNNVIEAELSFYTGAATTSTNLLRPVFFSEAGHAIGGFQFNMNTKRLDGYAYGDFNQTGTPGNYTITLATNGLILPASTWVRVGFAYDTVTGVFSWACNDVTPAIAGYIQGAPGYEPAEFDVMSLGGTANTVASTMKIDDILIEATPVEDLLSVEQQLESTTFTMYPNPTNGILNFVSEGIISSVSVIDINGRVVKNNIEVNANSVNVSDLSSGLYFVNISTDKGSVTRKFIKN